MDRYITTLADTKHVYVIPQLTPKSPSKQHSRDRNELNRIMSTPTKKDKYPFAINRLEIVDKPRRRIGSNPEMILDAPACRDDYYSNLLDWSCKDLILVGLDKAAYIYQKVLSLIEEIDSPNTGIR
jgi:hypothetical protein